jgi:hypothetical protein
MGWRRGPIRDLNNSEQFGSDSIRRYARGAVENLGVVCDNSADGSCGLAVIELEHAAEPLTAL